jgi:hypothetical protein
MTVAQHEKAASWLASCIHVSGLCLPAPSAIDLAAQLFWLATAGNERGVNELLISVRKKSDGFQVRGILLCERKADLSSLSAWG